MYEAEVLHAPRWIIFLQLDFLYRKRTREFSRGTENLLKLGAGGKPSTWLPPGGLVEPCCCASNFQLSAQIRDEKEDHPEAASSAGRKITEKHQANCTTTHTGFANQPEHAPKLTEPNDPMPAQSSVNHCTLIESYNSPIQKKNTIPSPPQKE